MNNNKSAQKISGKGNNMYPCKECGLEFRSSKGRSTHINSVHKLVRYTCKLCDKEFRQPNNLENHIRLHTGERPFSCSTCGKSYVAKKGLTRHLTTHLGEVGKKFDCQLCGKKFVEKSRLNIHMRCHLGERNFQCDICQKRFLTNGHLLRHKSAHSGEKKHCCNQCSYKTNNQDDLNKHILTHNTNKLPTIKCPQCDKMFRSIPVRQYHIRRDHPDGGAGVQKLCCIFCGRGFLTSSHLFRHIRRHVKEKSFSCELCGKEFAERPEKNEHIRRNHTLERSYKCRHCSIHSFMTLRELKRHSASHGKHKHKCRFCGRTFRYKSRLGIHEAAHENGSKLQCGTHKR